MSLARIYRCLTIWFFVFPELVFGQQEPKWGLYMFNDFFFNPSVAGATSNISAFLASRKQWVGIPGDASISTTSLSVNGPVRFLHGGVGLLIMEDEDFFTKNQNLRLSYSFRVPMSRGNFGVGFYGGLVQLSVDGSKFKPENPNDPLLFASNVRGNSFDFGAGVNYLSRNFFLNLAINRINQPKVQFNNSGSQISFSRNLFFSTGYTISLGKGFLLIPSILYKSNFIQSQFDGNLRISLAERIWIGGGYSQEDSFNGFLGFRVFKGLRVGYLFSNHSDELGALTQGTHEAFLSYNFKVSIPEKPVGRTLTPRYF